MLKKYLLPLFALFLTLACNKDDSNSDSNSTPTVVLTLIDGITAISASAEANVSNDGGEPILSKGVCWSVTPNPDINDNKTNNGSGSGAFLSILNNLTSETQYYVRAYATNSLGTIYSEEEIFTTLENIFNNGIGLATQEEVEIFGANNYVKITGNVLITKEVVDLSPLASIREIQGQLIIRNTTNLETLEGLDNLERVRDLRLSSNAVLRHMNNLQNLMEITGNFSLGSNHELLSIQGLSNVTSIQDYIWIQSNSKLSSLNGLENISVVNNSLYISSNHTLETIEALSNLEVVNGRLRISSNEILVNLNGLENLTTVNGVFEIYQNYIVQNLDPLSQLTSVSEGMEIVNNDLLDDFCGLTPLIVGNGLEGGLSTSQNAYNPTEQDIRDGNCSI